MSDRTPWPAMLAAACGLGIWPAHFWRLSLCEWRALIRPTQGEHVLRRADFEALARRFPD
jgi:uncharacterized phage protein (TIGR02216 family)